MSRRMLSRARTWARTCRCCDSRKGHGALRAGEKRTWRRDWAGA